MDIPFPFSSFLCLGNLNDNENETKIILVGIPKG